MKTLIDQSGLVVGSDLLSLSQTLTVKGNLLIDYVNDAAHNLSPEAKLMVGQLYDGTSVSDWSKYAQKIGLSTDNTWEIFLFLNDIGAIQVQRNLVGHIKIYYWRLRNFLSGNWPRRLTKRWCSGLFNISRAVLRAMWPVIFLALITAILSYGIYLPLDKIIIATLSFLTVIWSSTVAHEFAHAKVIDSKHLPYSVLQKGLRIGILHQKLTNKSEIFSALLGPLVGVFTSLIICFGLFGITKQSYLMLIGFGAAAMHLFSWLPAYGDGQTIWNNVIALKLWVKK